MTALCVFVFAEMWAKKCGRGGCLDLSCLFISRALLQMDAHPRQEQQSSSDTVDSSVQALMNDAESLQHGLAVAH